jgi:membrane protein implicated in regulation of membrane protease activity
MEFSFDPLWSIAVTLPLLAISPSLIWLILGLLFCGFELMLPNAFVSMMMGVSALIMAGVALVLPHLGLQVLVWMGLSGALVFKGRQFFMLKQKVDLLAEASEAETLTEIPPGKLGRVLFEGNSWQARCADDTVAIAPNQKVYVVSRQGTTLIVMPEDLLHS